MALTSVSYSADPRSYGLTPQRKLTTLGGLPSPGASGGFGATRAQSVGGSPSLAGALYTPRVTTPGMVPVDPGSDYSFAPTRPTSAPAAPKPASGTAGGSGSGGQSGSSGSSAPGTTTPGLDADPILAQIKQLYNTNPAQGPLGRDVLKAQDAARKGKVQLLENLGDAGLAQALGLGSNVAGVAQTNPNSIFKQLELAHAGNVGNIDQNAALKNIYFGSRHANQLSDEAKAYQQNRYNADEQAKQQIANIDATLAQALQSYQDRMLQGAADANSRLLAAGPTGSTGGAGDTGATGGSGSGSTSGASDNGAGAAPPASGLSYGTVNTAPNALSALALALANRGQKAFAF